MKTRFLNKMAGLLAVLLLFSCTGKFEEYNTDKIRVLPMSRKRMIIIRSVSG